MQIKNIKLLPILLVMLLIFLQYRLWFQSGGVIEMMKLKKALSLEQEQNFKLKQRNDLLLSQVQFLQKEKEGVESRAREELGMIKKGETFYQIVR